MHSCFKITRFGTIQADAETGDLLVSNFEIDHYGSMNNIGEGTLMALIDHLSQELITYRKNNKLESAVDQVQLDVMSPMELREQIAIAAKMGL